MPRSMRWAAGLCVLLSLLVMVGALQEVGALLDVGAEHGLEKPPTSFMEALGAETTKLARSALGEHRELRILVLILLSGACGLSFASAARILRPLGLRREPLRKLLSRAAVAVAVLRTVDGAQTAGTMQAVGRSLAGRLDRIPFYEDWLKEAGAELPDPAAMLASAIQYASFLAPVAITALMVVPFALFSRYFASDKAKEIIAAADANLPESPR